MARTRRGESPTIEPSSVVGLPGAVVRAPSAVTTPGYGLRGLGTALVPAGDTPTTDRPASSSTWLGRQVGAVGQLIGQHETVALAPLPLDAPTSLTQLSSEHIATALDAATRQRKRAAGGAASSAPLLGGGGAARPVLSVRGLLGS